jgi:hypothetical protein
MYTINYSKRLTLPDTKQKLIGLGVAFAVNYLKIDRNIKFNVYFFHKDDKTKPKDITLACYNPSTNDIYVRADNRVLMDILRSFFHEMEHLRENNNEGIDWDKFDDIHCDTEYNANKQAGIMCKVFAKENNAKWINSVD